jgi:hypothetical protein
LPIRVTSRASFSAILHKRRKPTDKTKPRGRLGIAETGIVEGINAIGARDPQGNLLRNPAGALRTILKREGIEWCRRRK